MNALAQRLKERFPWLGTEKSIDFRDECVKLAEFYDGIAKVQEGRPVAKITRGKLVCSCGRIEVPQLSEHGYSVTHDLQTVNRKAITARGWDGNSNRQSETGTHYTLDCAACYKEHDLPKGMGIDWT